MKKRSRAISKIVIAVIAAVIIVIAGVGIYFVTIPKTTSSMNVTIGYVQPPHWSSLPLYVAMDEGYFHQNGINVTLEGFSGGPPLASALTSGSIQFGLFAWDGVVTLHNHGASVQSVATWSDGASFSLITKSGSGIHSLADLKGKTVGVAADDLTQWIMQYLLNESGYNPNTYVHFVYVGLGAGALAALQANNAQAVLQFTDEAIQLVNTGNYSMVYDLTTDPSLVYPANVNALSSYISSNPAAVKGVVKSFIEANQFIHNNQNASLQILEGLFPSYPKSSMQNLFQSYLNYWPSTGVAPLSAFNHDWSYNVIGSVVNATQFSQVYNATVNYQYTSSA